MNGTMCPPEVSRTSAFHKPDSFETFKVRNSEELFEEFGYMSYRIKNIPVKLIRITTIPANHLLTAA